MQRVATAIAADGHVGVKVLEAGLNMQRTPGLENRKLFALNNKEKGTETDNRSEYNDKETNQTRPYVCEGFQSSRSS